jgi:hypothetical protein
MFIASKTLSLNTTPSESNAGITPVFYKHSTSSRSRVSLCFYYTGDIYLSPKIFFPRKDIVFLHKINFPKPINIIKIWQEHFHKSIFKQQSGHRFSIRLRRSPMFIAIRTSSTNTTPKESYIYSKRISSLNTTPSESNAGIAPVFYKHSTSSRSRFLSKHYSAGNNY